MVLVSLVLVGLVLVGLVLVGLVLAGFVLDGLVLAGLVLVRLVGWFCLVGLVFSLIMPLYLAKIKSKGVIRIFETVAKLLNSI